MNQLISRNIIVLEQGLEVLSTLNDKQYANNDGALYNEGAGRHFRHIIEHYHRLLEGYTNRVNYDNRTRGTVVEREVKAAVSEIRHIIDQLEYFYSHPELLKRKLEVCSNTGDLETGEAFTTSSVNRELQFLLSHTIHHYALISFILKSENISVPAYFGKALSSLHFEDSLPKL